jgi:hypothetical protein
MKNELTRKSTRPTTRDPSTRVTKYTKAEGGIWNNNRKLQQINHEYVTNLSLNVPSPLGFIYR